MAVRPVIFVSGVCRELKCAQQSVAGTLRALGYEAVWEDIADTGSSDLRHFIERKIDASSGVVQLVGRCYGAEPPLSARPGGRVSYTQYEAHYARQCGKKVWYLILDKTFPTEPHEPEPKELRTLQAAYLRRVRNYTEDHAPLHNLQELQARVTSLRGEFDPLRRPARVWKACVALLLAVGIGAAVWAVQRSSSPVPPPHHAQPSSEPEVPLLPLLAPEAATPP